MNGTSPEIASTQPFALSRSKPVVSVSNQVNGGNSMLLVMDVGNTNIALGLYEGENLLIDWRAVTRQDQTADEFGILIKELFFLNEIQFQDVTGIIFSCVVPPLLPALEDMCRRYLRSQPMIVSPALKTGISIQYDNPGEVGADRIVNAVAALAKYPPPIIAVDFGTATTFDVISKKGEYLGGVICPGISISAEALYQRTAKLPRIELIRPKAVIGKNTVQSMQSGLIYGYTALVDGLIDRMSDELDSDPYVVATGGLAYLIAPESRRIKSVNTRLTLEGLRLIYEMNI